MDTPNAPVGPTGEPTSPGAPTSAPTKPLFSTRRLLIIAAIGLVAGVSIYLAPRFFNREEPAPNYPRFEMGGTSTMFVVVENQWKIKYRADKHVDLAYESTGTTAGVAHLLDGKYSIAFTHGALTADQRQKANEKGGAVHVPILFFGVAPVYKIKDLKSKDPKVPVPPLNLTGELLAEIFMGNIAKWNDPKIEKINPSVVLPATPITVVHRADSSGTTLVFTEYLNAVTATTGAWRNKYGTPASVVKWPATQNFVAADRNLGVARKVNETDGAIGYVDRMFTSYDDIVLDYAAVQNKDGSAYVRAEPANMTAAAVGIKSDDLIFDLMNRPGKDAYPISGVIYAVCLKQQPTDVRQRVVDFLHYATHEGQPLLSQAAAAPLPPELVKQIDQTLETIK